MTKIFKTIAYHKSGTENAQKSVVWQNYYTCKRKDAWLGEGIYFWERKQDAEAWDGRYVDPIITSAMLKCPVDKYLNLDTTSGLKKFKDFVDFCQKELEAQNAGVDFSADSIYLICPIFCTMYKAATNTALIKYSFPKNSNKPQYCATDGDIISDIKIASTYINGSWGWI